MTNDETNKLSSMVLAPWIAKAIPLTGVPRFIGGNSFRHCFQTLGILLDYNYVDSVLLKTAVIHDLIEDLPHTTYEELRQIDNDSERVVALLKEVTNVPKRPKAEFLNDILHNGSREAKIIKCADRIANLIDLQQVVIKDETIIRTLYETKEYVYPMACQVNHYMSIEISDLINNKRKQLNMQICF